MATVKYRNIIIMIIFKEGAQLATAVFSEALMKTIARHKPRVTSMLLLIPSALRR